MIEAVATCYCEICNNPFKKTRMVNDEKHKHNWQRWMAENVRICDSCKYTQKQNENDKGGYTLYYDYDFKTDGSGTYTMYLTKIIDCKGNNIDISKKRFLLDKLRIYKSKDGRWVFVGVDLFQDIRDKVVQMELLVPHVCREGGKKIYE